MGPAILAASLTALGEGGEQYQSFLDEDVESVSRHEFGRAIDNEAVVSSVEAERLGLFEVLGDGISEQALGGQRVWAAKSVLPAEGGRAYHLRDAESKRLASLSWQTWHYRSILVQRVRERQGQG